MHTLLLHSEKDTVFTCMAAVKKGDNLEQNGIKITAVNDIPVYHKIAKVFIKAGDEVYKFGEPI